MPQVEGHPYHQAEHVPSDAGRFPGKEGPADIARQEGPGFHGGQCRWDLRGVFEARVDWDVMGSGTVRKRNAPPDRRRAEPVAGRNTKDL